MSAMCVLLVARVTDWMLIEGIGVCSFIMCIKKCRELMSLIIAHDVFVLDCVY